MALLIIYLTITLIAASHAARIDRSRRAVKGRLTGFYILSLIFNIFLPVYNLHYAFKGTVAFLMLSLTFILEFFSPSRNAS